MRAACRGILFKTVDRGASLSRMDDHEKAGGTPRPSSVSSALEDVAGEVANVAASGSLRLAWGAAVIVASGAAVWFLGESTGQWWPWVGLAVLASGAFAARLRWPFLRYAIAASAGLGGAAGNLLLGATTPLALGVAAVAALVAVTALLWSFTEALLTT